MDLKNCKKCGRLFAYDGKHKVCEVCREAEETDFEKVKDYLWDNPGASIPEVHEETGVEKETIIKFIREDRLISEGLEIDVEIECERCGKAITHGRFCDDCQQELVDGFNPDGKKKKKKKRRNVKNDLFIKNRIKDRKNR